MPSEMQIAVEIMMGLGLAACTGLRAWLPLLCVGLLSRLGYLHLNESFDFLARNDALIVFAAATVIEIVGDKIIVVDHFLDAVGTFVRPAAGTVLASSMLTGIDPLHATLIGLFTGGATALTVHAGKSLARAQTTSVAALHGGAGNAAVSTAEDVATGAGMFLSIVAPIVAVVLALIAIAASVWLVIVFAKKGSKLFSLITGGDDRPPGAPPVSGARPGNP